MKIIVLIIMINLCFCTCIAQKQPYILSGKIAKSGHLYCEIYTDGNKIGKFRVRPKKKNFKGKKNVYYNGFNWFGDDKLLTVEKIEIGYEGAKSNNLVVLDINGNLIERLIQNEEYYYTGESFPTYSGERILLTSYNIVPPKDRINAKHEELLSSLTPSPIVQIMNYSTKAIEFVSNISKNGILKFDESPWSPDEGKFVYTICNRPPVTVNNNPIQIDSVSVGSYIYDTKSKKDIKFISGSTLAIWSPSSNLIAYLKENNIWLYNLDDDTHTQFINSTDDTKIKGLHWTPNGDFLHIHCVIDGQTNEKLYSIRDKKEVLFKKMGLTNPFYSWR